MSLSLPAVPSRARSLTEVLPEAAAALEARSHWLPPARSAIVFVVDGLGARNLAARTGHARFLAERSTKSDVAYTVFPSTTAAALTSLLTGMWPGDHGIVGYRVRIPGTEIVANQLRGWGGAEMDPRSWQRATPITATRRATDRPTFVVSRAKYLGSGFTEATLRGAEFATADDLAERVEIAAELCAQHAGALIYLYAPDLDVTGHKHGWESDAWAGTLERVDGAARSLENRIPADAGVLVTADHGMVDVPAHRQMLLEEHSELLQGVSLIGGEPRMLHLYAEEGRADAVLNCWRAAEQSRSWVLSRAEAIDAGLFGPSVHPAVRQRIGDVLVAARARIAYYDDRLTDKAAQRMIGQHGSLTDQERAVPLIRLGAFA